MPPSSKKQLSLAVRNGVYFSAVLLALQRSVHAQCDGHWFAGEGLRGTNGYVSAMTNWDPDAGGTGAPLLVVAGRFTVAANIDVPGLAAWDPEAAVWSPLGGWGSGGIYGLATEAGGALIIGGDFSPPGEEVYVGNVSRLDAGVWTRLGSGFLGPNSVVNCVVSLPGGGIVAGGSFTGTAEIAARNIARWNGAAWEALGDGLGDLTGFGNVKALVCMPNGDIVAAGDFAVPGGWGIARWNGGAWTSIGGATRYGLPGLVVLPDGDLVATGSITVGARQMGIGRWNGVSWQSLYASTCECQVVSSADGTLYADTGRRPTGTQVMRWSGAGWEDVGGALVQTYDPSTSKVYALAVLPGGQLVVGGDFNHADADWAASVARLQDGVWRPLSNGFTGQYVSALAVMQSGDVVAAGGFLTVGRINANMIARWDGDDWSPLGTGTDSGINDVVVLRDGSVVAGGAFTLAGGVRANRIARWDGTNWLPLGDGLNEWVGAMVATTGAAGEEIIAGGRFTSAGGVTANRVARWNGASWSPMGEGMNYDVSDLVALGDGRTVAGGYFTRADGVTANGVAIWDGTAWRPLGSGVGGVSSPVVFALAVLPDGSIVAAGNFTTAGGNPANHIARWNGSEWSALGTGLDGIVRSLSLLPRGELIAGGRFFSAGTVSTNHIARWDGQSWSSIGDGLWGQYPYSTATVSAIAALPFERWGGGFIAGGDFLHASGAVSACLARWQPRSCVADFNCSGSTSVQDVFDYLDAWFHNSPAADINGIGGITLQDLFDFLEHYFGNC